MGQHLIDTNIVIAATAIVYDLTLLTDNEIDFSGIGLLKLRNPDKA